MSFYGSYPIVGGSNGVTSLNGLTGALTLVGGAGITITPSGSNITITNTVFNSQSANLVFAGPSSGIAATPTFRSLVVADLPTGNLTDVGTDGIVITGGSSAVIGSGTSIAQTKADTTHNGYLSSTDWNTFNGKQASGSYITALTGDVTATGPGSAATTLATVNTNVGSFGSSTAIPAFTVNGKGLITAASTNVVIAPAGTLSGTTLNSSVVSSSLTSLGTVTTGTWSATAIALNKITAVTANRAVISDGSGFISAATTTATEIGFVNGVTSAIQTQINAINSVPTGTVTMFAGSSAPTGWLALDGSAINRTTFAALFALFGTTYGVGDGSTTFNLPNTQGVFIRGSGSQTISAISYSGTRGTTQGDQLQGHFHSITNTYNLVAQGGDSSANAGRSNSGSVITSPQTIGSPTTDGVNGTPRTGTQTYPANIVLLYIVKT